MRPRSITGKSARAKGESSGKKSSSIQSPAPATKEVVAKKQSVKVDGDNGEPATRRSIMMRSLSFDEMKADPRSAAYADNDGILSGYRYRLSWWGALQSLFRWHNETINVWSHAIGSMLFVYFLLHLLIVGLTPGDVAMNVPGFSVGSYVHHTFSSSALSESLRSAAVASQNSAGTGSSFPSTTNEATDVTVSDPSSFSSSFKAAPVGRDCSPFSLRRSRPSRLASGEESKREATSTSTRSDGDRSDSSSSSSGDRSSSSSGDRSSSSSSGAEDTQVVGSPVGISWHGHTYGYNTGIAAILEDFRREREALDAEFLRNGGDSETSGSSDGLTSSRSDIVERRESLKKPQATLDRLRALPATGGAGIDEIASTLVLASKELRAYLSSLSSSSPVQPVKNDIDSSSSSSSLDTKQRREQYYETLLALIECSLDSIFGTRDDSSSNSSSINNRRNDSSSGSGSTTTSDDNKTTDGSGTAAGVKPLPPFNIHRSDAPPTWPIAVFFVSAIICQGVSSFFHLFYVLEDEGWFETLVALDYVSIALLIGGSTFPIVYFGFYCHATLLVSYASLSAVACILCLVLSLGKRFSTPQWRLVRITVFIITGSMGAIPFLHLILSGPQGHPDLGASLWGLFTVGALYVGGALLYGFRIPERLAPGHFDILFSSHQIFHMCVLGACLVHYSVCLHFFRWRTEYHECPPGPA